MSIDLALQGFQSIRNPVCLTLEGLTVIEGEVSGIYAIRCLVNDKIYIGSAVDIFRRWSAHRSHLNKGKHHSRHLQNAWDKYGADAFEFEILELVVDVTMLAMVEQEWLDAYGAYHREYGFNNASITGSTLGVKHSDETRAKMSMSQRGRKHSDETRAKMSKVAQGRMISDETRAKLSAALKGRKLSDEHRAKTTAAKWGRKRSDETQAKISAARRGASFATVIEVRRRLALGDNVVTISLEMELTRRIVDKIKHCQSPYDKELLR